MTKLLKQLNIIQVIPILHLMIVMGPITGWNTMNVTYLVTVIQPKTVI